MCGVFLIVRIVSILQQATSNGAIYSLDLNDHINNQPADIQQQSAWSLLLLAIYMLLLHMFMYSDVAHNT